jgi:hypothetical protein
VAIILPAQHQMTHAQAMQHVVKGVDCDTELLVLSDTNSLTSGAMQSNPELMKRHEQAQAGNTKQSKFGTLSILSWLRAPLLQLGTPHPTAATAPHLAYNAQCRTPHHTHTDRRPNPLTLQ